jgi:hypothetical protein
VLPQLPLLLREQGFSPARPVPEPCVLLAGRAADGEADELSRRLAAAGVPAVRLDGDRGLGPDVSWDPASAVLRTPDGAFQPVVGWVRDSTASPAPADEWAQWARLLTGDPGTRVLNPVPPPDRTGQLTLARAAGLAVPRTVVTTRPGRAGAAIPGDGDLIVKSLGGRSAHRITRAALAADDRVEPVPVIVQEFVEAAHELRVYAVAGEFHAFEITVQRAGAALVDAGHVPVRLVALPEALRAPLTRLVRLRELDVAAFDLLVTADGAVFLGVDAARDWRWLERAAGAAPVTAAVLGLLLATFRAGWAVPAA